MPAKKSKSSKGRSATARARRLTPNSAWHLVGPDRPILTREAALHYAACERANAEVDKHMTAGPVKEVVAELVNCHKNATAIAIRLESYIVEENKRIEAQLSDPRTAQIRPVVPAGKTRITKAEAEAHWATSVMLGPIDANGAHRIAVSVLSFADVALKNIQRQYPRAVHQRFFPLEGGWSRAEWRMGPLKRQDDSAREQIRILNASQIPETERPTAAEIANVVGRGTAAVRQQARRMRKADEAPSAPSGRVRQIRLAKYGKPPAI